MRPRQRGLPRGVVPMGSPTVVPLPPSVRLLPLRLWAPPARHPRSWRWSYAPPLPVGTPRCTERAGGVFRQVISGPSAWNASWISYFGIAGRVWPLRAGMWTISSRSAPPPISLRCRFGVGQLCGAVPSWTLKSLGSWVRGCSSNLCESGAEREFVGGRILNATPTKVPQGPRFIKTAASVRDWGGA